MGYRLARSRRSGFTLIELIVVMGMLAMLFGLGVGLLGSINPGKRAALGLVQNVIRAARNNAVARAAPARVRLDPATGRLRSAGMEAIGTWQFESLDLEGSSGVDGICKGGELREQGFLGSALSFAGAPAGSHAEVPLHDDPTFDLREGFMLQCAVWLDDTGGARVLDVGGVAGLECRGDGSLRGWFKPEITSPSGLLSGGGIVAADSPAREWRPKRWLRLEVHYDRKVLRVYLDRLEVARTEADDPVWKLQGPLVIGDLRLALPGAIDALSVFAVSDSAEAKLPKGVALAGDAPREIWFSADGALDRERHAGPLSVGLEYEDGSKVKVLVNAYGTVE